MNKRTEAQALAAELERISSPDVSKMYQPERGTLIRSADTVVRQEALLWKALDVLGRTDSEPGSRAWERESELIAIIREHLGTKPAIPEKPSFDLDAACKEALNRVRNSIHADAHNHRVHVRLAFAEASRQMVGRWFNTANCGGVRLSSMVLGDTLRFHPTRIERY